MKFEDLNSLTIDEINLGEEFINSKLNTISIVTAKTSNSVELFNRTDRNNRYTDGQKDADGEVQTGRCKGVDAKNWYTLQDFNRYFKEI